MIVFLPFFSAFLVPQIEKTKRGKSSFFVALVCLLCFFATVSLYPKIRANEVVTSGMWNPGIGINLYLRVDALSFLIGLISAFLWMLASIYSIEYMGRETLELGRYNLFSLLSLTGMLGVAFSGNLLTLYIFFEFLTIAAYVLVIHEESLEAIRAGTLYLFLGIAGGLILLLSVIATYAITNTGELHLIGMGLKEHPLMPYIFWGYIIGFGIKAGLFPLHVWLPKAHPIAPSPASALLSGIMIKAGGYGILRTIYNVFGWESFYTHSWLLTSLFVISLITILLGSAVAIAQTEIKKMLAYSSISQMGYIILGLVLITPLSLTGGIIHIFNHAIIKGGLFLCAGTFIHQTGLREIKDLSGIGKRMPLVTLCFTLFAFSMIGFPSLNGFVSKWYLALGTLEAEKIGYYSSTAGLIALGILLLSSLMNLIYYGPIVYNGWFAPITNYQLPTTNYQKNVDPNFFMAIPLILLAACTIFFGIYPKLLLNLTRQISETFFR
ncbi:MAG TPA: monovalent cation/H+ antiporter subunit D family protein [Elusimicrobia bacterium]|nr:monovalent cation/H+ antiporter subunit D family protein [Elusimicrobiota bacterium]